MTSKTTAIKISAAAHSTESKKSLEKNRVSRRTPTFYIMIAAALLIFIQTFHLSAPILFSFLLILLITFAIDPLVSRLREGTGGRKGAAGLIVATFIVIMALSAWALTVPLSASLSEVGARIPKYWERLQRPLIKIEKQAELSEEKLNAEVTAEVVREAKAEGDYSTARRAIDSDVVAPPTGTADSIRVGMTNLFRDAAGSFAGLAINGAQILVVLITVLVGVIFTIINPRPILGWMFSVVPEGHHKTALLIFQRIAKFMPLWALATISSMATIGILVFLTMWPIFGLSDALLLGLIAGMFEVVPYIGPILASIPAILFALGSGNGELFWVILAYLSIQALENNFILPLIMARSMRIHPLALVFSMLICVALFGVLGVLIAAPVVAIVGILRDEIYRKRFLPNVTDDELERLARLTLHEPASMKA